MRWDGAGVGWGAARWGQYDRDRVGGKKKFLLAWSGDLGDRMTLVCRRATCKFCLEGREGRGGEEERE